MCVCVYFEFYFIFFVHSFFVSFGLGHDISMSRVHNIGYIKFHHSSLIIAADVVIHIQFYCVAVFIRLFCFISIFSYEYMRKINSMLQKTKQNKNIAIFNFEWLHTLNRSRWQEFSVFEIHLRYSI